MNKIPIKSQCKVCEGEGYLNTGKYFRLGGRDHPQLTRCPECDGLGTQLEWLDIRQLVNIIDELALERQAE